MQAVCLEAIQATAHDLAAPRRRRRREHCRPREAGRKRLGLRDGVPLEVGAELGKELVDGLEPGVPDEREGRYEDLGHHPAGGAVEGAAPFLALEDGNEDLVEECLLRADLDSLPCKRERRRREQLPRQPSHPCVGVDETLDEPRNGDRRLADVEELRRGIAEIDHDLVHRAARASRDRKEAIDGNRLPVGTSQEEEPTPRRPGQRAFGDKSGQGRRHHGVHRRPSLAQGPGSCLDGMTAPSCNRASHARSLRRCSELGWPL